MHPVGESEGNASKLFVLNAIDNVVCVIPLIHHHHALRRPSHHPEEHDLDVIDQVVVLGRCPCVIANPLFKVLSAHDVVHVVHLHSEPALLPMDDASTVALVIGRERHHLRGHTASTASELPQFGHFNKRVSHSLRSRREESQS